MLCPICNVDLLMADKQGVEIDYCPKCRGIWLDRGELEKIIERTNQAYQTPDPQEQDIRPPVFGSPFRDHDHHDDHGSHTGYGYRRKKGFLGELFDF